MNLPPTLVHSAMPEKLTADLKRVFISAVQTVPGITLHEPSGSRQIHPMPITKPGSSRDRPHRRGGTLVESPMYNASYRRIGMRISGG